MAQYSGMVQTKFVGIFYGISLPALLIYKHTIMDATKLLHADYLDIIYDNRNKNYGAYELRKHYNQRLGKAVAFLLTGFGALICFSLAMVNKSDIRNPFTTVVAPSIVALNVIPKTLPKLIHETPPPPPPHVKTKIRTEPVIDPTDNVPDDKQMIQNKNLTNANPGLTNSGGDSSGTDIVPVKGTGTGVAIISKSAEPLKWVEQMPQFTGDMDAYISSHLQYPDAAQKLNIDGKVMIRFVVNEDGSVSDATIARGIGGGCDQEALRMVSGMPKWKPGKQNGNAVKVYFTLPINFVLK